MKTSFSVLERSVGRICSIIVLVPVLITGWGSGAVAQSTVTVAGTVTKYGAPFPGVRIELQGNVPYAISYTDQGGHYSFSGIPRGSSVAITPYVANNTFQPPLIPLSNLNADRLDANFVAMDTALTYTISGTILANGVCLLGAQVIMTGDVTDSMTTSCNGQYSFWPIPQGSNVTIRAAHGSTQFDPSSRTYNNVQQNFSGQNFVALGSGSSLSSSSSSYHSSSSTYSSSSSSSSPGSNSSSSAPAPSGVSTETCGQGRVLFNGVCQTHEPSARTLATVQARHNSDYPARASWVWQPNSSGLCEIRTFNDQAGQDATRRLNYYRWLLGAQSVDHVQSTQADWECATIQRRNGLNHYPPSSAQCYTAAGAAVAATSNLSGSSTPVGQLASYVTEDTQYHFAHRRYLLAGSHDVSWANTGGAGCNHLYFGTGGAGPSNWYAWPPAGFVPKELNTTWWQFSKVGSFATNLTVSVKNLATGQEITIAEAQALSSAWNVTDGMYAFAFRPQGVTTPGTYQVTLKSASGVPQFQYVVACSDLGTPASSSSSSTGFSSSASSSHSTIFSSSSSSYGVSSSHSSSLASSLSTFSSASSIHHYSSSQFSYHSSSSTPPASSSSLSLVSSSTATSSASSNSSWSVSSYGSLSSASSSISSIASSDEGSSQSSTYSEQPSECLLLDLRLTREEILKLAKRVYLPVRASLLKAKTLSRSVESKNRLVKYLRKVSAMNLDFMREVTVSIHSLPDDGYLCPETFSCLALPTEFIRVETLKASLQAADKSIILANRALTKCRIRKEIAIGILRTQNRRLKRLVRKIQQALEELPVAGKLCGTAPFSWQ